MSSFVFTTVYNESTPQFTINKSTAFQEYKVDAKGMGTRDVHTRWMLINTSFGAALLGVNGMP